MPYSEKEMYEIERDPVRLRGYFWKVGMNARRQALELRALSKTTVRLHPVNNYKEVFVEGKDLLAEANIMDSFSKAVLENIDVLVKSCLVK